MIVDVSKQLRPDMYEGELNEEMLRDFAYNPMVAPTREMARRLAEELLKVKKGTRA